MSEAISGPNLSYATADRLRGSKVVPDVASLNRATLQPIESISGARCVVRHDELLEPRIDVVAVKQQW
jgi:hypothetical protein